MEQLGPGGMNRSLRRLVTLLLLLPVLAMLVTAISLHLTAAARPESVDVLIGWHGLPDPILVAEADGEIRRQFEIVNVTAARVPSRAVEALSNHPAVRYVELDRPVYASGQTVPWGITRVFGTEEYPFLTWGHSTGTGIAVAVLDTGIDASHEDLNVLGGVNTIDATNWWDDVHGHGTHVAGTIAALDNELGVVGVAPQVDLYAVKVLADDGRGSAASVIAGIEWAVNNGIRVLNMSYGAGTPLQAEQDACDAAYAAGLLLVSSAGNEGNMGGGGDNVTYPAGYASVIAVAASTTTDTRASFSSTGPAVELIAPGVSILSTVPGNAYGASQGTSMAAPHVAGIAALVWAAAPDLSNVELRAVLSNTAEDLGLPAEHQGSGLARADLAVSDVIFIEGPPVKITAEPIDLGTVRAGSVRTLADTVIVTIEGPSISELKLSASTITGGANPWSWGAGPDADEVNLTITITSGPAGALPPQTIAAADTDCVFFTGESVAEGSYAATLTLTAGSRVNADLDQPMSAILTYAVTVDE